MTNPYEISDDTPVYVISVAAELSGMHPQTLRSYDRLGLVSPGRSAGRGRGRRYSLRDVLVLREVQRLSQAGVSLPGIKRIMELEGELDQYRAALAEMAAEMAQLRTELESTRAVAARLAGLLRSRDGRTGGPVTGPAAAAPEPPPAARESTPVARESTPAAREPGPDLPAAGTAGDPPPEAG
jgi:MerR family transcriptional regulator/heat shock protein HspR